MNDKSGHNLQAFASLLVRLKWPLFAFVCALTIILSTPASRLAYDQSIESFFAPDSPMLQQYQRSRRAFGGDEFLIVGFEVDEATSAETLDDIEKFSQQLSEIPGIRPESMQDLASILRNERAPGWMRVAMRLPNFKRSIMRESRDMLVSQDDKTVAIAMRLEDVNEASVPRSETFRRVRELAASHDPPAVVAGEPLQVHDMFQYVEEDAQTLGIASSLILMGVILILFRSLRWVVLPIILIQATLIWTKGLLQLTDMKLSMVSSMLTSLVTIIAVATMMHVTLVFLKARAERDRREAFLFTFQQLAAPVLWTCLSTAVGFAALLTSNIVPVRSFAIMMAVSTILIPVMCCLVLPLGVLIGKAQADPQPPLGQSAMVGLLRCLSRWSNRHPVFIGLITLMLCISSVLGLSRIQVETDFSQNFRPESPIVQAIDYFESRMGGVGSWEIGFPAPERLNDEVLNDIRNLTAELRELQLKEGSGLTKVISITDGLDLIPKVPLSTTGSGRLIPSIRRLRPATLDEKREILNTLQPEVEPSLHNPDEKRMRIMLRSLERQPAEVKLKLIGEVEDISRKYFPDAEATGLYVLLANLISSLLDDQLVSFLLAAGGVSLMMSLAFRSIKLGLISLIPNVLPILVLIGSMSWLEIPINIGTAMIASVSMGLTVDSTIHYLTTYLRFRREGLDHETAAESAHGDVGLALVLANIGLVAGFSVLILSNFVPLADFGILVSIAMVGGLLSNIFLMPVLLRWVTVRPEPQTMQ